MERLKLTEYQNSLQYESASFAEDYIEEYFTGAEWNIQSPTNTGNAIRAKVWEYLNNLGISEHGSGRFLDFGCGPIIIYSLMAAPHFAEVYMADFAPSSRASLRNWRERDPTAFNWSSVLPKLLPFLDSRVDKSNSERPGHPGLPDFDQMQEELRLKLKNVLSADILAPKPEGIISPDNSLLSTGSGCVNFMATGRKFSMIMASLVLVAAVTKIDQLEVALVKLAHWLEPGGFLLEVTVLNQHGYKVGKENLHSFYVTREQVLECYDKAGLKVVKTDFIDTCGGLSTAVDGTSAEGSGARFQFVSAGFLVILAQKPI